MHCSCHSLTNENCKRRTMARRPRSTLYFPISRGGLRIPVECIFPATTVTLNYKRCMLGLLSAQNFISSVALL